MKWSHHKWNSNHQQVTPVEMEPPTSCATVLPISPVKDSENIEIDSSECQKKRLQSMQQRQLNMQREKLVRA